MRLVLLLLCVLAAACRRESPPAAIDPAIASCIPAGTTFLAGVDLDRLRASPLYRSLSPGTSALAEPLRNASVLVLASNATSLTAIARGNFTDAPAGATVIAPGLAISGSPDGVAAARAQHSAKTVAASQMLFYAEPVASNPIWAVALGTATLPLSGNLANLNNFLHSTAYTTVSGRLGDRLSLDVNAVCRTPDDAAHLQRTLRAFVSFAGMRGNLGDVALDRKDRTVHVAFTADPSAAERLLH